MLSACPCSPNVQEVRSRTIPAKKPPVVKENQPLELAMFTRGHQPHSGSCGYRERTLIARRSTLPKEVGQSLRNSLLCPLPVFWLHVVPATQPDGGWRRNPNVCRSTVGRTNTTGNLSIPTSPCSFPHRIRGSEEDSGDQDGGAEDSQKEASHRRSTRCHHPAASSFNSLYRKKPPRWSPW